MVDIEEIDSGELLAMLKWYSAAGVDMAVSDTPANQFGLSATKPVAKSASKAPKRAPIGTEKPKKQLTSQISIEAPQGNPVEAKTSADAAQSLKTLEEALNNLQGCALSVRATQLVFSDGNPKAKIMLVGKAPSRDDDMQGTAFSGPAGALLDNMLKAIGLDRSQVYLANIVPWRPPGNRDPAPHEIDMCLPFLKRQVELVAPDILITLGEMATKTLLTGTAGVAQLRGQWQTANFGKHETQVLASLHPEFLLKQPAQKRLAWADLLQIKKRLDAHV